jgi:RNA polymerase sigma factor (sigma-70 family)
MARKAARGALGLVVDGQEGSPAGLCESEERWSCVGTYGSMAISLRRNVRVVTRGPAVRCRDEAAGLRVGALFDEFAPMVLAICRYQLRDPHAAEDAAQETFLSAHRSLLGGTRPRDPAAWLATIARNECRRVGRAARPAPLDEETTGTHLDPADIVADRSDLYDVASAIAELPARQREALVLRELCGLSYDQVATAMSVSGAAVDSLLSRARRRLIEQLGDIPRAAHATLVVPASLREELSRLIPGLDAAGAAAGAGAGGVATLASLGSAPVAAKVAATCAATVALTVPMQATVRGDEGLRAKERPHATASETGRERPPAAPTSLGTDASSLGPRSTTEGPALRLVSTDDREERDDDSSGHGSGDSGSSGPGSGSDSSGPGSGSGSGSSGSGSSGSDSSGSGPSGSESSGSDSSGSGSSGSGSSGSASSGSGSGSSDDD